MIMVFPDHTQERASETTLKLDWLPRSTSVPHADELLKGDQAVRL